jgi:hypothetical protein
VGALFAFLIGLFSRQRELAISGSDAVLYAGMRPFRWQVSSTDLTALRRVETHECIERDAQGQSN